MPEGHPLDSLPAGVLRDQPHAPGGRSALCRAGRHVSAAALAAAVADPGHVAVLEWHLCWRVEHHPPAHSRPFVEQVNGCIQVCSQTERIP